MGYSTLKTLSKSLQKRNKKLRKSPWKPNSSCIYYEKSNKANKNATQNPRHVKASSLFNGKRVSVGHSRNDSGIHGKFFGISQKINPILGVEKPYESHPKNITKVSYAQIEVGFFRFLSKTSDCILMTEELKTNLLKLEQPLQQMD